MDTEVIGAELYAFAVVLRKPDGENQLQVGMCVSHAPSGAMFGAATQAMKDFPGCEIVHVGLHRLDEMTLEYIKKAYNLVYDSSADGLDEFRKVIEFTEEDNA